MGTVEKGDPVTIIETEAVVLGVVKGTWAGGRFSVGAFYTSDPAAEGITWLRGWHFPDSKEVNAARSAKALSPPSMFAGVGATVGVMGATGAAMSPSMRTAVGAMIGAAAGAWIAGNIGSQAPNPLPLNIPRPRRRIKGVP